VKYSIFYSTATKIGGGGLSLVAEIAGRAIEKSGKLDQLVCFGKEKSSKVININRIYFQPAKVFSFLPSKYYYSMKRYWLDLRASHYLKQSKAKIFHGWTHESLKSIRVANKKGMLTILERGNPHPQFSKETLDFEYKEYRSHNFFSIDDKNLFLRKFNHYRYELDEALLEIKIADYIFVNSKFCASTYIKFGVDKKKIVILPRGFDPDLYFVRPPQKKDDKFIVLFVGEMLLRKGIKYILEAWKDFPHSDAELWFVGHVSDEVSNLLNDYQKRFDNIKCFGKQTNVSSFLQKASVFVFPSLDEGSAKVTYEAMASGLPCIFTVNSGSQASKNSAIIIPIRSSNAIKDALIKLKDDVDYRNKLGLKAAKVIRKFTWRHYQDSLIFTYKKLLAQKFK
jgi:glycosyltransferase involved in cell wall biosynthesis